jgi:hypothetical protein
LTIPISGRRRSRLKQQLAIDAGVGASQTVQGSSTWIFAVNQLEIDTSVRAAPRSPGEETRSRAQRRSELVLRAWSELSAMKLAEALATIAAVEAACAPLPMASIDLPCALLQAVSMALRDDAEAAAALVEDASRAYAAGDIPADPPRPLESAAPRRLLRAFGSGRPKLGPSFPSVVEHPSLVDGGRGRG